MKDPTRVLFIATRQIGDVLVTTPLISAARAIWPNAQFKEKGAYPIFMTAEETLPFLLFYENNIRPLFHNFKDLYNM